MAGREGFKVGIVFFGATSGFLYSRMPATVELSKVPMPVKYGLASIKKRKYKNELKEFGFDISDGKECFRYDKFRPVGERLVPVNQGDKGNSNR